MTQHHEEHLDLCAAYALGVVDDVGRRRLDEHLAAGCSVCEAALADFGAATVALASTAPTARPTAGLRDRVLTAVRTEQGSRGETRARRRGLSFVQVGLVAASIALLATSATLWQRVQRLTGERDTSRAQVETLAREFEASKGFEQLLTSPDCVDLASTGAVDTTLHARACFDPSSGRALIVFNAAVAPTGSDYELWVLRGDRPTSLGVVRADASGRAVIRVDSLPDATDVSAFAISLEPTGGSTAAGPTGPVIRVAALGG